MNCQAVTSCLDKSDYFVVRSGDACLKAQVARFDCRLSRTDGQHIPAVRQRAAILRFHKKDCTWTEAGDILGGHHRTALGFH
jgi:hypothetical protein